MKAVVLVGGQGTRLRPLTLHTPKQMLPVAGRPMIERVLAHLAAHGVDEVVLSLGYRPDAFRLAYPSGTCAGVKLHYAVEPEPRDTAGGIAFAARHAGLDETFVVQNGDVLTGLDITALVDFHRLQGGEATISLTPVDDPSRYGVVATDADGRVTAFIEKPPAGTAPSNLINAGTYVLEPSVIERIAADRPVSIERETFPALVVDGSLFALASDAEWVDAGTVATYLQANLALAGREKCWVDDAALVDPGARVSGSIIGAGVVVGAGAHVEGALVMAGARVGVGAVVRDSIIGSGATVGDGAVIEALSILGDGEIVAAGLAASGQLFPSPLL
jgi:mannose-1-phosphate guanylyltransferase